MIGVNVGDPNAMVGRVPPLQSHEEEKRGRGWEEFLRRYILNSKN